MQFQKISLLFLFSISCAGIGLLAQTDNALFLQKSSIWPSSIIGLDVTSTLAHVTASASYEHHFHPSTGFHLYGGIGGFFAKDLGLASDAGGVLFQTGFWTGAYDHHFEFRAGLTVYEFGYGVEAYPVGSIGYRYHNSKQPFVLRIFIGNVSGVGFGAVLDEGRSFWNRRSW